METDDDGQLDRDKSAGDATPDKRSHHEHSRQASLPLLLLGGGSILILKLEFQEQF